MRKWQDAERCRDAQRHAQTAAAPPTVGISERRGGEGGAGEGGRGEGRGGREGGRGGVLPKRLKFGSDHHRLDVCGSSNGRTKLM